MAKSLSVRLHGKEVGILSLVDGKMEFLYNKGAENPISLSLPIQEAPFKEKACRGRSFQWTKEKTDSVWRNSRECLFAVLL